MTSIRTILFVAAMAIVIVIGSTEISSAGNVDDNLTISLFGHQGRLQTDTNSYIIHESTEGGFSDFAFGMVVSAKANEYVSINAQFSSSPESFGLDWGFGNVALSDQFSFRAGLVKIPLGLYGETQDVRFLQPFAFLPQAAYATEMEAYFGGGMFASFDMGDNMNAELDLYTGEINLEHSEDEGAVTGKKLFGFRSMFNLLGPGISLGGSYLSTDVHEGDEIEPLKIWMFSAELEGDKYFVRGESGRFDHDGITNWAYIETGYLVSPKFQPVFRYTNQQKADVDPLALATMALIGQTDFQNEVALGINYFVVDGFTIKAEHHFISGTGQLHDEELEEVTGKEKWGLTSIGVAFSF